MTICGLSAYTSCVVRWERLVFVLAFVFSSFAGYGEKRYIREYSGYQLDLPGEPYCLRPEKNKKPLRGFTDEVKKMWSDTVLQERIALGIETNRKGDFFLYFRKPDGSPAQVSDVKVEMLKHDFLFGCQAFNVSSFGGKQNLNTGDKFVPDPEVSKEEAERRNELYESEFANIFNFATVPFYWRHIENENGKYRFGVDSEPLFRRPPPDLVLKFAKKYGIKTKGHCLSWHILEYSKPDWIPFDKDEVAKYLCRYIKSVANRYDGEIMYWDVSNEITDMRGNSKVNGRIVPHFAMPENYAYLAFKESEKRFSQATNLILNFTTPVWQRVLVYREYSSDYQAVSNLINSGAKVDVIGLQLHFFSSRDRQNLFSGLEWGPYYQLAVLDTLGRLNRPIHITELTFPCMDYGDLGEENQAFMVENFYKLWFSHKNVEAITYWHFVDGSNGVETKYNSGFLRKDFSRKPSYEILDRLINREWRTNLEFKNAEGLLHFRAFYGKYRVSYAVDGKTYTFETQFTKHSPIMKRVVVE